MSERDESGVVVPKGHTGSSLFHHVLHEAVDAYPSVFSGVGLPEDPHRFKKTYGDVLVRFEAARVASTQRVEVARFIAQRTQRELLLRDAAGQAPLDERMSERLEAPSLVAHAFSGAPGVRAEVPFEGTRHRARDVIALAERMREAGQMTDAALAALRWIVEHIEAQGGVLSLAGTRVAILGAGAELAPTEIFLAGGAEVLYIDVADNRSLRAREDLAGRLWTAPSVADLLRQPREIAAAIAAFAAEGPVHIGMFAYAAGASREWRLGAAMNAIVRSLEREQVESVSLLVSPTTAASMRPEDVDNALRRFDERPAWQAMLHRLGLLPVPGHLKVGARAISKSIVSIQGLSYQAAQYISKLAAAESYAVYGLDLSGERREPVTVSANTAGITNTRSLAHPLFQAAFVGAAKFGVHIFEPATTRALGALLLLHDLLNPQSPGAKNAPSGDPRAKIEGVFSQQVHGGIYGLPYVLDPAIRASAVLGMLRRPKVLWS